MKKLIGLLTGILLSFAIFAPVASAQSWGWAATPYHNPYTYYTNNYSFATTPAYTYYKPITTKYYYNTYVPHVSPYTKALYNLSTLPDASYPYNPPINFYNPIVKTYSTYGQVQVPWTYYWYY